MMPVSQPQNIDRELNLIREVLAKASSGIIVLPAKATPDAIAAGTSMYLALTKMGKTVSLICSQTPQSDMVAADKIKSSISVGGNNLMISFPYKEGAVDKVDYNFDIENEKFNLIIVPREGFAKLDAKDVQYAYSGGNIEFIITIDTPNLNSLGNIYEKNQSIFSGKNIINIDRHLINNNYGTINLVVKTASSTSELICRVLEQMKVDFDRDMATNLYSGIVAATNNFSSYSVNADTFESVATLLRAGAVKKPFRPIGRQAMQNPYGMGMEQNMNMNSFQQMGGQMGNPMGGMSMQMPRVQRTRQQPVVSQQMPDKQTRAIEEVEQEVNDAEGFGEGIDEENADWLKPKIFNENDGLV